MSEGETLYLFLLVFYLLECGYFAPRGAQAFHSAFGGKCRPATSLPIFEGRPGVARFANPLPPLGRVFVTSSSPLSFSPEGLIAFVPWWPGNPPRREQTGKILAWEEIQEVATIDREVRIDGRSFLVADSREQAARVAADIAGLMETAPVKREGAIEKVLRSRTDSAAARERVAAWEQAGADHRFLANVLLLLLFLGIPLTARHYGVEVMLLPGLAALLVLTGLTLFTFRQAHRRLYPEERGIRVKNLLLRAFAPPALIRAPDVLSQPLLAGFHPLAAAAALLPRDDFREYAAGVLRDVVHPLPPAAPEDGAEIVSWYRRLLDRELRRLIRGEGIDPEDLLRLPVPTDAGVRSCCPRCLAEFTIEEGECSDCALPLVSLPTA